MILAYPLIEDPTGQYNELRFSLRSAEKHLSGFTSVMIVGAKPSWLTGATVVPYSGLPNSQKQVTDKISIMCQALRPKPLIFMNDDFYFLSDINAGDMPLYHTSKTLRKRADEVTAAGAGGYAKRLSDTADYLLKYGFEDICFECHQPLIIRQPQLMRFATSSALKDDRELLLKSIYGNMVNDQRKRQGNTKIHNYDPKKIAGQLKPLPFFSSGDGFMQNGGLEFLESLYPNKSKFEL